MPKVIRKKPKTIKKNQSKDDGWTDYESMNIVKFDEIGDMVVGKFEGFREGKYGQMIILTETESGNEVLIPSLATLKNLIDDLERWDIEHKDKEIHLSIEYIGNEACEDSSYEYKTFTIKHKFKN